MKISDDVINILKLIQDYSGNDLTKGTFKFAVDLIGSGITGYIARSIGSLIAAVNPLVGFAAYWVSDSYLSKTVEYYANQFAEKQGWGKLYELNWFNPII